MLPALLLALALSVPVLEAETLEQMHSAVLDSASKELNLDDVSNLLNQLGSIYQERLQFLIQAPQESGKEDELNRLQSLEGQLDYLREASKLEEAKCEPFELLRVIAEIQTPKEQTERVKKYMLTYKRELVKYCAPFLLAKLHQSSDTASEEAKRKLDNLVASVNHVNLDWSTSLAEGIADYLVSVTSDGSGKLKVPNGDTKLKQLLKVEILEQCEEAMPKVKVLLDLYQQLLEQTPGIELAGSVDEEKFIAKWVDKSRICTNISLSFSTGWRYGQKLLEGIKHELKSKQPGSSWFSKLG